MIVKSKYILPPNDQRLDQAWEEATFAIKGSAQCQGNSNERLLRCLAKEYELNGLSEIDTFNYYSLFSGIWKSQKDEFPDRNEMMTSTNHAFFMNVILEKNNAPVRIVVVDAKNNPELVHETIARSQLPVSLGTSLTPSRHWISVHYSDSEKKIFRGNDSYGTFPYKTKQEQTTNAVEYSWEFLQKKKINRILSAEKL